MKNICYTNNQMNKMKALNNLADELQNLIEEAHSIHTPCVDCKKYFLNTDDLISIFHTGRCMRCDKSVTY